MEWVSPSPPLSSHPPHLTDLRVHSPAGVFELAPFAAGSESLLTACIDAHKKNNAVVIVGGGDTATVVAKYGKEDQLSHISTGGGASLELLEGKELPGVGELSERA